MSLLRSPAAAKLLAKLARRVKVQLTVERVSVRYSACGVAAADDRHHVDVERGGPALLVIGLAEA